jgi:fatty acid desaturase
MPGQRTNRRRLIPIWRAVIEVGFIVFLFYSNLLMGEFTFANGHDKTLAAALMDIFTATNLVIALVSAFIGYMVVEYLRKKL